MNIADMKTRARAFASTAGARVDGTTDASNVYDELFKQNPDIRAIACLAHTRRKFFDIATASAVRITTHEAIERINALFEIERHASEQTLLPKDRQALRQERAVPLIAQFRTWAIEQVAQLSPQSPTAKAFGRDPRVQDVGRRMVTEYCCVTPCCQFLCQFLCASSWTDAIPILPTRRIKELLHALLPDRAKLAAWVTRAHILSIRTSPASTTASRAACAGPLCAVLIPSPRSPMSIDAL